MVQAEDILTKTDTEKLPEGKVAKSIAEKRTERIERLRELTLNTMPEISSERVRYYTEAYKQYEMEPVIMKRVRALDSMLEKMSIYILDGELLVGNTCRYPRGRTTLSASGVTRAFSSFIAPSLIMVFSSKVTSGPVCP